MWSWPIRSLLRRAIEEPIPHRRDERPYWDRAACVTVATWVEDVKDFVQDAVDKAKDTAEDIVDKAKDSTHRK